MGLERGDRNGREHVVDGKLAAESLGRLVETYRVEQIRVDVHLEASHVVEPDAMLFDQPPRGIERAQEWLKDCRSAEAAAWLRLALLANGSRVPPAEPPACRTSVEAALWILADAAAEGRNLFV